MIRGSYGDDSKYHICVYIPTIDFCSVERRQGGVTPGIDPYPDLGPEASPWKHADTPRRLNLMLDISPKMNPACPY